MKLKVPHTLVLLYGMIVLAYLLTVFLLFSLIVRTVPSSKPSGRWALISTVTSTSQPSWAVSRSTTSSRGHVPAGDRRELRAAGRAGRRTACSP